RQLEHRREPEPGHPQLRTPVGVFGYRDAVDGQAGSLLVARAAADRRPHLVGDLAVADLPVVAAPAGRPGPVAVAHEVARNDPALAGLLAEQDLIAQAVPGAEQRNLVQELDPRGRLSGQDLQPGLEIGLQASDEPGPVLAAP